MEKCESYWTVVGPLPDINYCPSRNSYFVEKCAEIKIFSEEERKEKRKSKSMLAEVISEGTEKELSVKDSAYILIVVAQSG